MLRTVFEVALGVLGLGLVVFGIYGIVRGKFNTTTSGGVMGGTIALPLSGLILILGLGSLGFAGYLAANGTVNNPTTSPPAGPASSPTGSIFRPTPSTTTLPTAATSPTTIIAPVTTSPSPTTTFTHLQETVVREGEQGGGDGQVMQREAASQQSTILLKAGESRSYRFKILQGGQYRLIVVRYSNDNAGPLERVTLRVDKFLPVQFVAQDTGNYGYGWNIFKRAKVKALDSPNLTPGRHSLRISVADGDGYGIEIDWVKLI